MQIKTIPFLVAAMTCAPSCDDKPKDEGKPAQAVKTADGKAAPGGGEATQLKQGAPVAKADPAPERSAAGGGPAGAEPAKDQPEAGAGDAAPETPDEDAAPSSPVKAAGDLEALVPGGAKLMFVLDAAELQGTPGFEQQLKLIEASTEAPTLEAARACKVGPRKWSRVAFAADPASDNKVAFAASVEGIGRKSTLECIGKQVKKAAGKDAWRLEDKDGRLTTTLDSGKATGFAVDDNTVLVVGKPWVKSAKALLDGKGKSAAAGSLKAALARADRSKSLYFAFVADDDLPGTPVEGVKNVGGSLDMRKGLTVAASLDFGDAAKAKAKRAELQQAFDGAKGMAGAMGVPQAVVNSFKLTAKGRNVRVSAHASESDLEQISKALSALQP